MFFRPQSLLRLPSSRFLPTLPHTRPSSSFTSRPGPPPLPRAQQREFEELLRRVNAPASAPAPGVQVEEEAAESPEVELAMHPDFRKQPKPTFEGNVNPVTGEVGGPKREPVEYGAYWSL